MPRLADPAPIWRPLTRSTTGVQQTREAPNHEHHAGWPDSDTSATDKRDGATRARQVGRSASIPSSPPHLRRYGASSPERATMMTVGDGVDELDIALLDVVHLNPQISFDGVGRVLDVSPVTVARRGGRLVTTRRAWVSSSIWARVSLRG